MIEPRHRWLFPDPVVLDPQFRAAAQRHGLSPRVARVLVRRGVADEAALASFFGPAEAGLNDPRLLPDAAIAVERIARARRDGERVLVFGDFDADGLTGLAILVLALRRLGIHAEPYVPSRLEEGHGLSLAAVRRAGELGASLIVTVDTGSTSVAEVDAARANGIDVLVTDHHRVPDVPPRAVALINPHRADSRYPDTRLSGSGVAFTVARLLLADLAGAESAALDMADLAVIGTVSDVAPVLGENRSIARIGLDRMRAAPRPGLAALMTRAHIPPDEVDLEAVGFSLAPRLNAAGRVGEALDAARLLLAETADEAERLADRLEAANVARRDLMRDAVAGARTILGLGGGTEGDGDRLAPALPSALIVRGDWPVGIVGLVAGRLADETGRPAIVGTLIGDVVRASCRGDGRLDLAGTLAVCGDLLIRHGGHRAAAGFEIAVDRWETFAPRFVALADAAIPTDIRRPMRIDLALPARLVDYALLRDLARLAPCGVGNPEPLLAVLGLTVGRVREANGGHTQLVLRRERDVLDAIAFGRADLVTQLSEGDRVDVVATVASRAFAGVESLELVVRDVAASGSEPRAAQILARLEQVAAAPVARAAQGGAA